MQIEVGTKLNLRPTTFVSSGFGNQGTLGTGNTLPCVVTYINRRHRWFLVEFDLPCGKMREAYKF